MTTKSKSPAAARKVVMVQMDETVARYLQSDLSCMAEEIKTAAEQRRLLDVARLCDMVGSLARVITAYWDGAQPDRKGGAK